MKVNLKWDIGAKGIFSLIRQPNYGMIRDVGGKVQFSNNMFVPINIDSQQSKKFKYNLSKFK